MLWSIVWFYEAMCIAGTLTYFVVVLAKEMVHYAKTKDVRFDLTKHDYVEDAVKYLFAGWFYGMVALNEYYNFLEYDAERQKEKA